MAAKKKKKKAKKAAKKKSPVKKTKKKAPARKAAKKSVKKKKAARKAAPAKAAKKAVKKKKAPKKAKPARKKQIVGEGDYAATRAFDADQAAFVKRNKAEIPKMGKDAEKALDGPEGDALREAEAEGLARSRDMF